MTINVDVDLCLSAQQALYRAVGPNLVRFTGEIRDKTIMLQFVVLDGIDEDEVEDYRIVGTEILADYLEETIDEQFVRVSNAPDADAIPYLNNHFFCRNLAGATDV